MLNKDKVTPIANKNYRNLTNESSPHHSVKAKISPISTAKTEAYETSWMTEFREK